MKRNPLTPDTLRMLATIAESAGASQEEMLNALVQNAYYKPHLAWETMLRVWKTSQECDRAH